MKKAIVFILATLYPLSGYCQFERTRLETDSTEVELIRNSIYRIWEESYKFKDSVFYSIRYIQDTTQLHTEGWKRKNEQPFGEWSEYNIDGTWLYTIDYTNHSWKYNEEEFKLQSLKDSMKAKADNILIGKFGKEFFDNNIVFNFYGHTYLGKWVTYDTITLWMQDKYLGSWTEPISQKPNSYKLNYTIKLADNEFYENILSIELDSTGSLIVRPSRFEIKLEEIVVPQQGKFSITREKAIHASKNNKLEKAETGAFQASLRFGWRKMGEYPGEFYYEVVQQYSESIDGNCNSKCVITRFFNVWRFDPWTSALIFKKPMKQITTWNKRHGETGDYLELN